MVDHVDQTDFLTMHSWQGNFNILCLGHERNLEQLASYQYTGSDQLQFILALNWSDFFFPLRYESMQSDSPAVYVVHIKIEVVCCCLLFHILNSRCFIDTKQKCNPFYGLFMCIIACRWHHFIRSTGNNCNNFLVLTGVRGNLGTYVVEGWTTSEKWAKIRLESGVWGSVVVSKKTARNSGHASHEMWGKGGVIPCPEVIRWFEPQVCMVIITASFCFLTNVPVII